MTRSAGWNRVWAVSLVCTATAIAQAQTFATLHSFDGHDGQYPYLGLVQAINGDFYGSTSYGGSVTVEGRSGTVFKVTPNGTLTTLHGFCSPDVCLGGPRPTGLVQDTNGNLYGATGGQGANGAGTVFKMSSNGKLTVLYNFCSQNLCADGITPVGGLIEAANGELYGTTYLGGTYGYGTVFKITPGGTLTALHSFDCSDGAYPETSLVQATDGNLYGTTKQGGRHCGQGVFGGTVFKITPRGTLTTLHILQSQEGETPSALIQASDGDLYGTTDGGGTIDAGTVFKITTSGSLTILHTFCSQPGCADGWAPQGPLVQATDGNFYGTTAGGGANQGGTIFRITPSGTLTTLYSFCPQAPCADGSDPWAGLVQSTNGMFYGTTKSGGASDSCYAGCGTIFSLDMGLGPFVAFVRAAGKVGQTGGILGQGFTGTTSVSFDGTPANFTVRSDTYLTATVPPGATTGHVTVATPSGVLKRNVPFHVLR